MKKQNSKPGYSLYSLNTLRLKKIMVKSGYKNAKKMTFAEIAAEVFDSDFSNNLDKHLLVTEVLWNHDGRKVIFPGSDDFYGRLLSANFSLDGDASLNLPYSTFILAMPSGFEVDGVRIPSVIVNFSTSQDRKSRYDKAADIMKMPPQLHDDERLSHLDSLAFFYQDPYEHKDVVVMVNQTPAQISSALKASSAEEYARILGDMPKEFVSPIAMDPSSTDHVIQFAITKIIAGISVYLSVKGINKLEEGLPDGGRLTISNFKPELRYSFFHLPQPSKHLPDYVHEMTMSTRSWFFRNLRDAKYYQNQYKDLPSGSRWIFVREAQEGRYKAEHIE